MIFEPTETREFDVRRVGRLAHTARGNPFIECETSIGTVAFWGGRSMDNLRAIQGQTPPFRVRCDCRPPTANFPSHALWVPETARIEFLGAEDFRRGQPSTTPQPKSSASPLATSGDRPILYIVSCTKAKIWDDDAFLPPYVQAQEAYRGRTVRTWLASTECKNAARWLFLSAKYGFIEPDHPISNYDVTFSDPASGPITDEYLRAQVQCQRRWQDRVLLRDFRTVYVWSDSGTYEQKVRVAFEPVGAQIVRLTSLTAVK